MQSPTDDINNSCMNLLVKAQQFSSWHCKNPQPYKNIPHKKWD